MSLGLHKAQPDVQVKKKRYHTWMIADVLSKHTR